MRKAITTLLMTTVLALPVANAVAATKTTTKKVVTRKFTGNLASVDRWGELQVTITVRKTTTKVGTRTRVTRKIIGLSVPVYPNHTDRSVFINTQALPVLRSEALRANSANIDMVSGATDSSDGFVQSLQSAILKAKHA